MGMSETMTTTAAATACTVTPGTIRRWCRTAKIRAAKVHGRWAIDSASIPSRQETPMHPTAPLCISSISGRPAVGGPAATITAALRGAHPVTITGRHATGDVVYLAPRTEQVWRDDAITVDSSDIARTIQHPEHGEIVYAWIDTTRLDDAPQLVELERQRQQRASEAGMAAQRRGRAMVPACDNCGDCRLCV